MVGLPGQATDVGLKLGVDARLGRARNQGKTNQRVKRLANIRASARRHLALKKVGATRAPVEALVVNPHPKFFQNRCTNFLVVSMVVFRCEIVYLLLDHGCLQRRYVDTESYALVVRGRV